MKRYFAALLSLLFLLGAGQGVLQTVSSPVYAQGKQCDLALVLAMDASSSVSEQEYALQLKGMAAAFLDPEIKQAIQSLGGIYLSAFEWNGRRNQKTISAWVWLETDEDMLALATTLAKHTRGVSNFPTAIGHALGYASLLFPELPESCVRHVVDVSGDGVNNEGFSPEIAYRTFDFTNVLVNGLVIKGDKPDPEPFYRESILLGPGSFLVVASGFPDFERALKVKLLKEIVPGTISSLGKDTIVKGNVNE